MSPGVDWISPRVAEHPTHRVDGHLLVAGLAAQPRVVRLLDAGAAHDRGAVDRVVVVLLRLIELALGDRAQVAEHVGTVHAERRGVGADALLLGQHAGVVLGLLEHLDRDLLRDVAGHRHGLVRRAVPAGALHRPGLPAQHHALVDLPERHLHDRGELLHRRLALRLGQLADQRPVDADHPAAAVGDQRTAHVVHDQAASRLHDDVADGLLGSCGPVALACEHLHVPEPREQRQEQCEDHRLHDEQTQATLLRGVRPDEDGGHVSRPVRPVGSARTASSAPGGAAGSPPRPRAVRCR